MGVLPLQFLPGENAASLGLDGTETYAIANLDAQLAPGAIMTVDVTKTDGSTSSFKALARIDSQVDVRYYRNGGILPTVLRRLMQA
jgi:aconitate hydratase